MKYIKLYFTYAKCSLMGKLTYKANVLIGLAAFLFAEAFSLLTLYLIISAVPSIDGFSIYQMGFLFGITNLAIGIDHLLSDRLWTVSYYEVKTGKMDHFFLRPLPVLFQVLASEIQLEALGELIVGVALTCVCASQLTIATSFSSVLLLVVGIICAAIIITSFKIVVASLAFIFKRSGPLLQIIYNVSMYSKYPLPIFPKVIQYILLFVIPLGLCLYVPFDNLFNPIYNPYLLILVILTFTIVFGALSLLIWKFCARRYESTGT